MPSREAARFSAALEPRKRARLCLALRPDDRPTAAGQDTRHPSRAHTCQSTCHVSLGRRTAPTQLTGATGTPWQARRNVSPLDPTPPKVHPPRRPPGVRMGHSVA